jgi:hypothetical protein
MDEKLAIRRHLADLDARASDLSVLDKALAQRALKDPEAARLMTISGIDMIVALGVLASIGDIKRFSSPEKLVSYLGLNPSVRQSGNGPTHHGRISKQGRAHARAMLVEAAWAAGRAPGPLRAFFLRIQSRRGKQIAAVATARKLATIIWHLLTKNEDYAWARPALLDAKLRKLELRAGQPTAKGRKPGRAHAYKTPVPSVNVSAFGWNRPSKPIVVSSRTGRTSRHGAPPLQTRHISRSIGRLTYFLLFVARSRVWATERVASLLTTRAHHSLPPASRPSRTSPPGVGSTRSVR